MVGLLVADELSEEKKNNSSSMPTQPSSTAIMGASNDELNTLDEELSQNINSLNELIKSIATNLKSM